MDRYEAMKEFRKTIIPSVKGTQWEEPIRIAADALMEKIQAEESVCESCKIHSVKDEVRRVVEG